LACGLAVTCDFENPSRLSRLLCTYTLKSDGKFTHATVGAFPPCLTIFIRIGCTVGSFLFQTGHFSATLPLALNFQMRIFTGRKNVVPRNITWISCSRNFYFQSSICITINIKTLLDRFEVLEKIRQNYKLGSCMQPHAVQQRRAAAIFILLAVFAVVPIDV
jgi:hypothetical protein